MPGILLGTDASCDKMPYRKWAAQTSGTRRQTGLILACSLQKCVSLLPAIKPSQLLYIALKVLWLVVNDNYQASVLASPFTVTLTDFSFCFNRPLWPIVFQWRKKMFRLFFFLSGDGDKLLADSEHRSHSCPLNIFLLQLPSLLVPAPPVGT